MYVDKELLDAGYDALANAIIIQACKDYRRAIESFDIYEMRQIRHFFHSQWFKMLSEVDGDYIIERIEREEIYERAGNVSNAIKKCNKAENRENK